MTNASRCTGCGNRRCKDCKRRRCKVCDFFMDVPQHAELHEEAVRDLEKKRQRLIYLSPTVRMFMIVTVVLLLIGACSSHVGNLFTGTEVTDDGDVVRLPGTSFYTILRLFVCCTVGWWALRNYTAREWGLLGIALSIVASFNPFWHPPLPQAWWQGLDVLVAAALTLVTWAASSSQRDEFEERLGLCKGCHGLGWVGGPMTCTWCSGSGRQMLLSSNPDKPSR